MKVTVVHGGVEQVKWSWGRRSSIYFHGRDEATAKGRRQTLPPLSITRTTDWCEIFLRHHKRRHKADRSCCRCCCSRPFCIHKKGKNRNDYTSAMLQLREGDWKQVGNVSESLASRLFGRVRPSQHKSCVFCVTCLLNSFCFLIQRRVG